jgi:TolA-binding protein
VLYEYGNFYLHQGRLAIAEKTFRDMLTATPEGSQDLIALARYGLARAAAAQGNVYEAQRLGKTSFTALEVMGHRSAREVKAWLDALKI